jgi:hypothetical protein
MWHSLSLPYAQQVLHNFTIQNTNSQFTRLLQNVATFNQSLNYFIKHGENHINNWCSPTDHYEQPGQPKLAV